MLHLIEGRLETELLRIAKLRAPLEAAGLILSDGKVIELPNRSDSPEDSFVAHRDDMLIHLAGLKDLEGITLWHSHPSGGVGPSKEDMRNKTPFAAHLVVSLTDDGIIATWY